MDWDGYKKAERPNPDDKGPWCKQIGEDSSTLICGVDDCDVGDDCHMTVH